MDYFSHEEISYCTLFELRLSQDELEVYESCMKYILKKCNDDDIYKITGCKRDELDSMHDELRSLIIDFVREEILPDKYK